VKNGNFPYLRFLRGKIQALGIGTIAASIACGDELVTASLKRVRGEDCGLSEVGLEEFLEKHPILLPAGRKPSPSGGGVFGFRSVAVSPDLDYTVI
jgi:hypothetical protein